MLISAAISADFLGFSDVFPPGRADLPHGDLRHPLPDHGGQVPAAEDTLWRLSSETRLSSTDAQNGKYQHPYFQLERTAGPAGVRAPEYDNPAYQVEQSMMIQSMVIYNHEYDNPTMSSLKENIFNAVQSKTGHTRTLATLPPRCKCPTDKAIEQK